MSFTCAPRCPCCSGGLLNLAEYQIQVLTLQGSTPASYSSGRCPACALIVFPYWARLPDGMDYLLPGAEMPPYYCFTNSFWVHIDVLEWFDGLLMNGCVTATDFLSVWNISNPAVQQVRLVEAEWFTLYLHHLHITYSRRGLFEGAFLPNRRYPLKLTGRQSTRRAVLNKVLLATTPVLRDLVEQTWVRSHDSWCSHVCAQFLQIDGNEKLAAHGCQCVLHHDEDGTAVMCFACPRRGKMTCSLPAHQAQEQALQAVVSERGRRGRPRLRRRAFRSAQAASAWGTQTTCNTLKTTGSQQAMKRGGVLCACFPCGVLVPPRRFHVAESLPQVAKYVEYLLRVNTALMVLGYDDWCHLAPHIASHGSEKARSLRGYIDRWHAKGHKRPGCWSVYSPDQFPGMWTWEQVCVRNARDVANLLLELQRGPYPPEIHKVVGWPWGSATSALRMRALLSGSFPLNVCFLTPAGSFVSIFVRSDGGRNKVVTSMRRQSVVLHVSLRGSGWDVPAGSEMIAIRGASMQTPVAGYSQAFLRSQLALLSHFPFYVILRRQAGH